MTTGTQRLLCEMLSCGTADLETLDCIGYGWGDILSQLDDIPNGVKYQNMTVIQLKKDGTYCRHTDFPPRTECWKVFTSLLNVSGFIAKYSNK